MQAQRAAALLLLGVAVAYTVLASGIEQAFQAATFVLGPRTFPLLLGSAGIVLSLLLLALAGAAERPGAVGGQWRLVLALCGAMLLYAAALPRAGFSLSTIAFLTLGFRLLGERRRAVLLLLPAGVGLGLLLLLRGGLGAYLPEPILERIFR